MVNNFGAWGRNLFQNRRQGMRVKKGVVCSGRDVFLSESDIQVKEVLKKDSPNTPRKNLGELEKNGFFVKKQFEKKKRRWRKSKKVIPRPLQKKQTRRIKMKGGEEPSHNFVENDLEGGYVLPLRRERFRHHQYQKGWAWRTHPRSNSQPKQLVREAQTKDTTT